MPQIAAIFDLDGTLLAEATPKLFVRYMRRTGNLWRYFSPRDVLVIARNLLLYRLGRQDAGAALQHTARIASGIPVEEFWHLIDRWFHELVVHTITQGGLDRLDWHRDQEHIPVICSAGSQFSVLPVARHLGIEHTVYTEWLSLDGKLTGELRLPIAYGLGKRRLMEEWASDNDTELSLAYAYGDHITDRYLLEAVGHPMAVNPDRKLAQLAAARGWPVAHWGRPDASHGK